MRTFVKLLIILAIFKLVLIVFHFPFDLRGLFQNTSNWLHQACLNSLSDLGHSTDAHTAAQALVCGHELENLGVRNLFTSTGLIHLLVVSGSHLIIIKKILDFLLSKIQSLSNKLTNNQATVLVFSILFLYVLMCLMNPPVTRSFFGLIVVLFAEKWKLHWPPTTQQFFTSSLALWFNPNWITSLSFQMSWLASLALNASQNTLKQSEQNEFKKFWQQAMIRTILIYVSFFFLFCYFGFPHPFVPLYSIILSPVLELILFPLALVATLGTWFSTLYLTLFSCLTYILNLLETNKPFGLFLSYNSVSTANLVLISAALGLLIAFRKKST